MLCLALFGWVAGGASAQSRPDGHALVRIGFESHSLGNMNRSDVTAAMKAWMFSVTKEQNLAITPSFHVYDSLGDMVRALRQEDIDVFSCSTDQFLLLEKKVPCKGIFASKVHGKVTEQYVLLVHRDRVVSDLKDLQGESIMVLDQPRASLAPLWLDVELLRNRLPVSAQFFRKITYVTKANLAILPVFFKQAGAALVSRAGFDLAGELNPQLSRQVRALMISPELIPGVGAYRRSANSESVGLYRTQALKLGSTPAGQIILNLFQIEGVVEIGEAELSGTRAFLAEYARIKATAPCKGTAP
jgi:ABC-type phosphate/phosphonate transport system substrate-binding protein